MKNRDSRSKAATDLRQQAEALTRERTNRAEEDRPTLSPVEISGTLHELRVHQIELEMQNEELRRAKQELEAERARYFDLYELAPVGYLTLSKQGMILESNRMTDKLLGTTRGALVKQPISRFIVQEDQDRYYLQCKQLFETGKAQECEMRLVKPDGTIFWAHLTATATQAKDGAPECGVVISDISERKRIEVKTQHLTQVLLAIRNVNQLITKEDDPQRLISGACTNLTETLGYHNAWIALLDGDGRTIAATASAGLDGRFEVMRQRLATGDFSECMRQALAQEATLIVNDPPVQCGNCPMACDYGGRAGFSRRLAFADKIFGILSVSVPAAYAHDAEEQSLFDEVVGDLGFALHKIELQARFGQNEERYRLALKATNDVVWDWDIVNDAQRWNEAGSAVFGWTDIVEAPQTSAWWVARVHPEDRPRVDQTFFAAVNDPAADRWRDEYRFRKADGAYAVVADRGHILRDADGRAIRMVGAMRDITERKRTEEALRESEKLLSRAQAIAHTGSWKLDLTTKHLAWSDEVFRIFGCKPQDFSATYSAFLDFVHPEDRAAVDEAYSRSQRDGSDGYEIEHRIVRRSSGEVRYVLERCVHERDAAGAIIQSTGMVQDITERKQSEGVLAFLAQSSTHQGSVDFFQLLARYISETLDMDFVCIDRLDSDILTAHTVAVYSNGQYEDNASYALKDTPCGEVVGKHVCCFPSSIKNLFPNDDVLQQMDAESYVGVTLWSHDGHPIGLIAVIGARPLTNQAQAESLLRLVAVRAAGELERRQAESIIEKSAENLRNIADTMQETLSVISLNGTFLYANHEAAWNMTGGKSGDIIGKNIRELIPEVQAASLIERYRSIYQSGKPSRQEIEVSLKNGDTWFVNTLKPIEYGSPPVPAVLSVSLDITERKQAEEALQASNMRFKELLLNVPTVAVQGYALDGTVRYWNRASETFYGYAAAEALGHNLLDLIIPPALHDGVRAAIRRMAETREMIPASEMELMRKDGSLIPVYSAHTLVQLPGQEPELFCIDIDLTELKQTEADQKKLQAQYLQAQKMESVGRLAGGVAHDFNNLLMGIMGYTAMCREKVGPDHPIVECLDEITNEAQRSANLTRQLLAFARKQNIEPRLLDLNDAVSGMLKLLRQLIGEDIALVWIPGREVWHIKVDPGQIDQILANLSVNARDAIGGVGHLTIETTNAVVDRAHCAENAEAIPGEYAVLTVSDDGCGMDTETLAHIFEPFFTTKTVSQGTGLGLSTVYGIARQNGGFINVQSEPGKGTTFRIYLPRCPIEAEAGAGPQVPAAAPGGSATIMLVDDEKSICVTTALFLQALGYTVLTAAAPGEALRLADRHPGPLHLLITDVVMPGMNGRDLAAKLSETYPGMKCLFISGYTADVIAHRGILEEGVHFLAKPFTRDVLARKVYELLKEEQATGT